MKLEVIKHQTIAQSSSLASRIAQFHLWLQAPAWPILTGGLVLLVYLVCLPFIERTWRTTGDEPHYLLAAHSLAADGDFDLKNNYDQLDYLNFYFSEDIVRQIRVSPSGQQILSHYLGYPLVIAPAYAFAGRLGVLLLQAILGGLLAGLTFQLAATISRNERAALLATVSVALTPPLFMYHYLAYPELIGAVLTTYIMYSVITRPKPTTGSSLLVVLSLITLPWLNRRFIPLAVMLAVLLIWAWRDRDRVSKAWASRQIHWSGLISLAVIILSAALLLWFNSQLSDPLRADFTLPVGMVVFERLARSVGWLVDQQRGLLIFAPVYVLAAWGIPPLLRQSWQKRDRAWFVLLPVLLALGVAGLAGGFWVAWELGPRSLVVALPTLAPLIALAWDRFGHSKLWQGFGLALLTISLVNSLVIIRNPEVPYKSSLPLYYGDKFGFELTKLLPDLAGYTRLAPNVTEVGQNQARIVTDEGRPVWYVPGGRPELLITSPPLEQLPFGHYRLSWPVRVEAGLPPSTEVLRLSIKLLGGGQVQQQTITAADLPDDGSYGLVRLNFFNPNVDRWRTSMLFYATSSGQSQIWAGDVLFEPDLFYGWGLPYLLLGLIVAQGAIGWSWLRRRETVSAGAFAGVRLRRLPALVGWGGLSIGLIVVGSYLVAQYRALSRTYAADRLGHFVGQASDDPETDTGRAWLVDPAVDPPQKAIYGPFDFYDVGQYQVAFRMKMLQAVETDQEIAVLQVNATANFEPLVTQPLRPEHFSRPDLYHEFVLTVANPRRQALSFDVGYTGLAPLAIESVTIRKIRD